MKKFIKWAGTIIMVLIIMVMICAFLGMKEPPNLVIKPVNLEFIQVAIYIGIYDFYR